VYRHRKLCVACCFGVKDNCVDPKNVEDVVIRNEAKAERTMLALETGLEMNWPAG